MSPAAEWRFLQAGLVAAAALLVLAVAGWRVQDAVTDEPSPFELLVACLRDEKGLPLATPGDPIARSAELGAVRTVLETNGVTIAVAGSEDGAERIADSYRAIAGDLGTRLELRGSAVYLWDGAPEPTQRQTLFDCTFVPHEYP